MIIFSSFGQPRPAHTSGRAAERPSGEGRGARKRISRAEDWTRLAAKRAGRMTSIDGGNKRDGIVSAKVDADPLRQKELESAFAA